MTAASALYTISEIRAIERAAYASLPAGTLMERAGAAACEAALALLPPERSEAAVLVLAGPGNNGGDALDAAARLARSGVPVTVLLHAEPARQPADAQQAQARAENAGVRFAAANPDIESVRWSLVIDGLFGIGLQRPIGEPLRALVQQVNSLGCPLLALDVPSGLDADTGSLIGADGAAIRATHTITFIGDKPGLYTAHGRDHTGSVQVASLGIDPNMYPPASATLNHPALFAHAIRPRLHNTHKGSYGDVAIIGGAAGMAGAAILAARAALKCGAGRVLAGFLEQPPLFDMLHPELMCRLANQIALQSAVLVIGPGLGTSDQAAGILHAALTASSPLVLDADGLNMAAADTAVAQQLAQRSGLTILTPHPLEAARLLGSSAALVQTDRPAAARELARRFNAIAVLKGSGTVIARPDGHIAINGSGNPGLATAGSGDVLAGICGALLAQHYPAWEAALAAVWLHGRAAEIIALRNNGPIGITASELAQEASGLLNEIAATQGRSSSATD